MVSNKETTVKVDVAVLQEKVHDIQSDLTEIKTNHLTHIYARLGKIENKLAYWAGGIVAATAVLDYIFRFVSIK